jgi:hypothetical protein
MSLSRGTENDVARLPAKFSFHIDSVHGCDPAKDSRVCVGTMRIHSPPTAANPLYP